MHLVVVGINHETASLELREKLFIGGGELAGALASLSSHPCVHESCIISDMQPDGTLRRHPFQER